MSALVIILFVFLALVLLVGVLFISGKKKAGTPAQNASAKPSPAQTRGSRSGILSRLSWWVLPLVLDIIFWSILYSQYNPWWWSMWHNQWLFWAIQGVYWIMSWNGRSMVNLMGRPEKPLLPKVMVVIIICLIFGAVILKGGQPPRQSVVAYHPTLKEVVRTKRAARAPLPSMTKKTFVVGPNEISTVIIPAHLNVARIDGMDNINVKKSSLDNGGSQMEITTKENSPAEVTLWLVTK